MFTAFLVSTVHIPLYWKMVKYWYTDFKEETG